MCVCLYKLRAKNKRAGSVMYMHLTNPPPTHPPLPPASSPALAPSRPVGTTLPSLR